MLKWLHLVLFVPLLLISFSGCGEQARLSKVDAEAIAKDLGSVDFPNEALTQHAVLNAANSERAVIFVHLDWTIEFPADRARFTEFMLDYEQQYPQDKVGFHYIDFTPDSSYNTLRSLSGWTDLEKPHSSLINGEQEIVWMARGRVLEVQPIHRFLTVASLVAETQRLYGNADMAGEGDTSTE